MTADRHAAGVLAGRREVFERTAALVRKNAALWRAEEANRGVVLSALLASTTETWMARLEALAAHCDEQARAVRAQEEAPSVPVSPPRSRAKKRNRKGRRC